MPIPILIYQVRETMQLTEMQNYIEYDNELTEEEAAYLEQVVEASEAIEPNRGEKYTAQGRGDTTVWWSMPSQIEKIRTEHMKRVRSEAFPYCTQNFNDKKVHS